MPLREVLDAARLAPDVEITARSADPFTNWIHRRTGDADIYFVANGRRRAEDLGCTFRVTGRRPELWDPMTGKTRALPVYEQVDGRTRVALRLDEAGSCFVVFREPAEGGSTAPPGPAGAGGSEGQTSELHSLMRISYAVFCLKNKSISIITYLT